MGLAMDRPVQKQGKRVKPATKKRNHHSQKIGGTQESMTFPEDLNLTQELEN